MRGFTAPWPGKVEGMGRLEGIWMSSLKKIRNKKISEIRGVVLI